MFDFETSLEVGKLGFGNRVSIRCDEIFEIVLNRVIALLSKTFDWMSILSYFKVANS